MSEAEARGSDHHFRLTSLTAFEASLSGGIDSGLASLGTLNDPGRVHAAIQLLVQNDDFQKAIDLVESLQLDCKWLHLAIYAYVALRDIQSAKRLLRHAAESCESSWVSTSCRISAADAVFTEVFSQVTAATLVASGGLSDQDRAILEFVAETLNPMVESVRLSGRVDGAAQQMSVEISANAYGLLGQMSRISELVGPMLKCRPIPLVLAQLTLRKLCDPPKGMPGRIRVEHPNNTSAKFLAAILDRECYGRKREAFEELINLRDQTSANEKITAQQLCQALFETASVLNAAALARARAIIVELLGEPNEFLLYLDCLAYLFQTQPALALSQLDSDPRHDDPIWWQVSATAREMSGDLSEATSCWDRACQIMPHPDILNRFAGLSIQQRRFDIAIRALKTAAVQSPENVGILEQLAISYSRQGQLAEAREVFSKLIILRPEVSTHRVNLALCQVRGGDPESAFSTIDRVSGSAALNLDVIEIRTEILNGLNRAGEAFSGLEQARPSHWENARFLILYMTTAYRAGEDVAGTRARDQLLALQNSGRLPYPIFHAVSADDNERLEVELSQQKASLYGEVARGRIPWLIAEALIGNVPESAWQRRTQPRLFLPEDARSRGEWTIYATNGFSVLRLPESPPTVSQISPPSAGENVVADMSALITLHRLGRLEKAATFFDKLILPASFGDLSLRDAQQLTPLQLTREFELRKLNDLIQQKKIGVIDFSDDHDVVSRIDEEAKSGEDVSSLSDLEQLLRATQRLTSQELTDLAKICDRQLNSGAQLESRSRICCDADDIMRLMQFEWLERILAELEICITRDDFEVTMGELRSYDFQRKIYEAHREMWLLINQLHTAGKIDFLEVKSRKDESEPGSDSPPYFDAAMLAGELDLRLLADDRFCQAALLNKRPAIPDAAFGTDLLVSALHAAKMISEGEVCEDIIKLIRWRYRFMLLEPSTLQAFASRSVDDLPGPELREIAVYVQESMRDPGLFCGAEDADPPTPIAYRYYMAWKQVCVEFLVSIWGDLSMSRESAELLTRWCLQSLLPAVPRGILYSAVGTRLAALTPKAIVMTAMLGFVVVRPVERANHALRLIAEVLGMSDDEFYEAAAEAANGRYQL